MKSIVILGAGISQVPLIRAARRMGLRTVVVSRPGNYPGFAEADRVCHVDTTDENGVIEAARTECADGICTTGTDVAVKALGRTVDALGLTGVSGMSAALCSDKLRMKQTFVEHGVKTAGYVTVWNKQEAIEAFRHLEAPLVFKAVDCGASKGIIRVNDPEQVEYAFDAVRKVTRQNYFIVEEFIEGREFGAQAFVRDGKVQFILPHGDMVYYGDAGVPVGHYVPLDLPEDVMEDIRDTLYRSVEALKLDNCAVNADFILKNNRVYVLEIGARAGATCLPELVSTYYGFDYYEQMIRVALGMEPDFTPRRNQPCACELLFSLSGGRIKYLENRNVEHPEILDVSFDYGIGDRVASFRVGTDRIGHIIVKGSRTEDLWSTLERVKRNLTIEIVPD